MAGKRQRRLETWKLTIEYDGGRYRGWQSQPNARTVQGELRQAAESRLGAEVETQGAGRTDAGVHARGQVAHLRFEPPRPYTPGQLAAQLNDALPHDIAVIDAVRVDNRFHARHDAVGRTYLYQISQRKRAFAKRYVWWVRDRLDVKAMAAAAENVRGRHDFVCFRAADPSRPDDSTIVVVKDAGIETTNDGMILFRIEASHFLWKMVRRLVGALAELGRGAVSLEDFQGLLAGRCDPKLDVAAWTAPPSGLFLEKVVYRPHQGGVSRVRSVNPRAS